MIQARELLPRVLDCEFTACIRNAEENSNVCDSSLLVLDRSVILSSVREVRGIDFAAAKTIDSR
ncbi:hypothetical protein XVE_0854 [Xanthomonas vesicatoria ATCC 35937]|uniref:Uncharacterized protein n=1 Tax=Xanthomonas vesicatoria ATCC 35937 TaxID=925775 RepID=F0B9V0_9XANT|nr:hypothetical protein XVE_0854 [Xanthomonas vesicatoria ATCC 35937]